VDPILIIDDENDNLKALQRLLRTEYDITTTTSPFEALKLLQQNEYAVIISDQRMPEMTGVELLEKAKHIFPISTRVLLTGYSDIEAVIDAINRGNVYRYISKPWDPEDFKLILRQAHEAYTLKKALDTKTTALSKSNEELKNALERLTLLDKAKAKFLSLTSHELNTPLTVLKSYVDLLKEGKDKLGEEKEKALNAVSKASDRFSEIVSEILTYVNLESEMQFFLSDVDLKAETEALKNTFAEDIKKKQLQLLLTHSGDCIAHVDPDKARIALTKLFQDTISRCPEKKEIKINIKDGDDFISYSMWRPGETMGEEAFDALETPGEQMHHQKGLGLALAICRLIVEGHGGEVELESSSDKGTTITLTLPKT